MKESLILNKSFAFAIKAVNAYKTITAEKKEFVLSKQFMRSATSIGANIEEANGAVSNPDFKNKLSIAYKEARETLYWLKLLHATDYISQETFENLAADCDELCRMLRASINTMINKEK